MLEIKKLSIVYEPASDRLALDLTDEEMQSCRVYLTRRLAMRWLKTICGWLEDRAGDDLAEVQRKHRLEEQHEQALTSAAQTARTAVADEAPPRDPNADGQLLTRFEFIKRKGRIGILLYCDGEVPAASGNFGPPAAHILVARLSRSMIQAGWSEPLPVPEWGRIKGKARQGDKKLVLH